MISQAQRSPYGCCVLGGLQRCHPRHELQARVPTHQPVDIELRTGMKLHDELERLRQRIDSAQPRA
jgi:hypothetical protein